MSGFGISKIRPFLVGNNKKRPGHFIKINPVVENPSKSFKQVQIYSI